MARGWHRPMTDIRMTDIHMTVIPVTLHAQMTSP
jgi:hypothetical protein